MENLLWKTQNALNHHSWTDGLTYYNQANCVPSIVDGKGFRVQRPANLIYPDAGSTMWGGLRLHNCSNWSSTLEYNQATDNILGLQEGHTYIIKIHIEGQTSNQSTSFGWTNQMGWGGGGLLPAPTAVKGRSIPRNFQGEMDAEYQFTISDALVKTCTNSYSGYTQGKQYLSYKDFMIGWGYESTGELGTDIIMSNFRMYDLTTGTEIPQFFKNGIASCLDIAEDDAFGNVSIHKTGTIQAKNFFEL